MKEIKKEDWPMGFLVAACTIPPLPRPLDKVIEAILTILPVIDFKIGVFVLPDVNTLNIKITELRLRLKTLLAKYLFLPPEANAAGLWEKAADILQGFLDDSGWAETARKVFKGELDYKDYLK